MSTYHDFMARKFRHATDAGIDAEPPGDHLYPWQRELVARALRAGRFALFTDTGTGKTAMQLSWASAVAQAAGPVLVLTPLAVAEQTVREALRFGVDARYAREQCDGAIVVTNYEMIDRFDAAHFAGVVLDESSILKAYDGATRTLLIDTFRDTPYRLACTATPSPNDHMELGNHAEFLGQKTRAEMLAEYFVHDGGTTAEWRIKGHARVEFWRWVASWAAAMRRPEDMGYPASAAFDLPPLVHQIHRIEPNIEDAQRAGLLFLPPALSLSEQRAVRKATMARRVAIAASIAEQPGPCLIWAEGNAEADATERAIADAVQVRGSDTREVKVDRLLGFADGRYRVLVTKPSIAGFGMNWQHCARVVFLGISHSFEQTYQAIRRCWRYGQTRPVDVHSICGDQDHAILANYERKTAAHSEMMNEMIRAMASATPRARHSYYAATTPLEVPAWLR